VPQWRRDGGGRATGRRGTRERAREEELERRSGWERRVERLGAGGGAGERPRLSTWPGKWR
jgi:hypothetical protein